LALFSANEAADIRPMTAPAFPAASEALSDEEMTVVCVTGVEDGVTVTLKGTDAMLLEPNTSVATEKQ